MTQKAEARIDKKNLNDSTAPIEQSQKKVSKEEIINNFRLNAAQILDKNLGNTLTPELANGIFMSVIQQPLNQVLEALDN